LTLLWFLSKKLHDQKISVNELNLGGGLGIVYTSGDKKSEIEYFVKTISQHLTAKLTENNLPLPKLMLEPGRSIIGEAGTTIYKIGSTKISKNQIFAAVNGGMNDNIRPSLYQAKYHAVIANKMHEAPIVDTKIVGKSCESGDVLIEQIMLPNPKRGDILAVFSTGAYNYSMASNYNRLPVPGMVLVNNGKIDWIVKPQTLEDVIRNDVLPTR
jgi:diaminopimelate decarboxylase